MTSKMNCTELHEVIHASQERVWEVLFHQYGDIHIHNPTMVASNYMEGGTQGELHSVRHCRFNEKLFVNEKIVEMHGTDSFKIEVITHNLPFLQEMSAIYEVVAVGDNKTALKMISCNSFKPDFMKFLMRGQLAKSLRKHLFGLKHYAETGGIVTADNYAKLHKEHA